MNNNPGIVNIPIVDVARLEAIIAEIYGTHLGIADLSKDVAAYDRQLLQQSQWSLTDESPNQGAETYSQGASPEDLDRKREAACAGIAQSEAKIQKLQMEWDLKMALLRRQVSNPPLQNFCVDPSNPEWVQVMTARLFKKPLHLYPLNDVEYNVGGSLSEQG